MNPDLLLFLRAWSGDDEPAGDDRERVLRRFENDAAFRAECIAEMRMLGMLKAVQSPAPRWLELADALGVNEQPEANPRVVDFADAVMQRVHASTARGWKTKTIFAMAAVLAILCTIGALWWTQRGVALQVVSVSESSSSGWKAGDTVRARHLTWVRGAMEMRLPSGVRLAVQGPADLEFVSAMEVRLLAGKVTADVGASGKGFVIETPETRVVDLGTVFGVDATSAAKTDVVVFKGQVEVFEKGAKQRVALLNQGEGLRMERNRRASRIVSVTGADEAGAWSAQERAAENAVITSVGDSMSASDEEAKKWPSLRNFYRVVPGGLHDGALAFADEFDEWSAVPQSLAGADLVRTFAADGFNWWMQMIVRVQKPCEFFVFVDARNEVPAWLSREFTSTGETITLEWRRRDAAHAIVRKLEYAIWKKMISQPGEVKLGAPYPNPPADRKSFNPNRMFGVAAKALP